MMEVLLQATDRLDPREALRKQFAKDAWDADSWTGFIVVAAAIAIFVLFLHFLLYYQKQAEQPRQMRSPERLFREVIRLLELTARHRAVLLRMARDLKMHSPTSMLLSPKFFSAASGQWLSLQGPSSDVRTQELDAIARSLFPDTG